MHVLLNDVVYPSRFCEMPPSLLIPLLLIPLLLISLLLICRTEKTESAQKEPKRQETPCTPVPTSINALGHQSDSAWEHLPALQPFLQLERPMLTLSKRSRQQRSYGLRGLSVPNRERDCYDLTRSFDHGPPSTPIRDESPSHRRPSLH